MKRVVFESPFAGDPKTNLLYAYECARDCIRRGEAPFASHVMCTQFLEEITDRELGIRIGLTWAAQAEHVAVYVDHDVSPGMVEGVATHHVRGKYIYVRSLIRPDHELEIGNAIMRTFSVTKSSMAGTVAMVLRDAMLEVIGGGKLTADEFAEYARAKRRA